MEFLDFEKPIAELKAKIDALKASGDGPAVDIQDEVSKLERKRLELIEKVFSNLTDWQIIKVARHPSRPYTLDYIKYIFDEYEPLHGDRSFADDRALVGGIAKIGNQPVMVMGQQKGRSTKEKISRNFGMPHPEGYRKAKRLFELAEKFNLPVITLIDTPGAYPGVNAEARGQSEAIARNLQVMAQLKVPIISVIIGEGCSGGALGIGVSDHMLMMQYSYFATISPEGCASILWKDAAKAPDAAKIMGITPKRLLELGIVDEIIAEPLGGAHRDHAAAAQSLKSALLKYLSDLVHKPTKSLLSARYDRLMAFGEFESKRKK